MSRSTFEAIAETIGQLPAETGGFLRSRQGVVDRFQFDTGAQVSAATFTPNVEGYARLAEAWLAGGGECVGVVHSHPPGFVVPSAADCELVHAILTQNEIEQFWAPIIQTTPDTGNFSMFAYRFDRERPGTPVRTMVEIVPDVPSAGAERFGLPVWKDAWKENRDLFSRLRDTDLELMNMSRGIFVGCGTARDQVVALARSGLGDFVLIDGDVVERSNIAKQGYKVADVGRFKVDVLAEAVLSQNPSARVRRARQMLDDSVLDSDFAKLLELPTTSGIGTFGLDSNLLTRCRHSLYPLQNFLVAATDSFQAQARCSRLAIKYQLPYFAPQFFDGGELYGGELTLAVPETTRACPRCILEPRYRAVLGQSPPGRGSFGAPPSSSLLVAGVAVRAVLEVLHRLRPTQRFGQHVQWLATHNYIQMKTDPQENGLPAFDLDSCPSHLNFAGSTAYLEPQTNLDCPDCGGHGFSAQSSARIVDSRQLY